MENIYARDEWYAARLHGLLEGNWGLKVGGKPRSGRDSCPSPYLIANCVSAT